jgi:hypothetical protein
LSRVQVKDVLCSPHLHRGVDAGEELLLLFFLPVR